MRARPARLALAGLLCLFTARHVSAQGAAAEPRGGWPVVTVHGETWNQQQLLQRNLGGRDDQTTQFPPHRVVGNIYYVGSNSLASYLIATPQGLILINSSYERSVPLIQKSVEALGFKFSDIKILLGSHAHGDHMEGDAAVKALTGAQVVAMAEDVPALERMTPGAKPHPIDRVIHDGDTVTLGGTTLVAHLTPGHSRGCTTWTLKVTDGGRVLDVVIVGSLGVNPGFQLVNNKEVPAIADEFRRAFKVSRALKCDVPLASHPAMYKMAEKHARLAAGGPNPFIDPTGYVKELDLTEAMFEAVLAAQTTLPPLVHAQPTSVFIEDLTWEEVAAALKAGKTTAIIYTGGGEQNGPHLAFGKHNAVARSLSERIARELGNALVYPVLPYSPAGDPSKKEGQFAFPGTSGLTDETYGMVLRDLTLGAATAGFRDVILIGDHGGGQDVLKQTAATLDARLTGSGTRVFYCDDLYFKSRDDFSQYLKDHKVTGEGHAGVEDTSAILYVKPEWVRKDKIAGPAPTKGVEGDPRNGRAELGKVQQDLKVKVAVAQIRAQVASHHRK